MSLLKIYKCLCDETRLRLLHLLAQGPLCVCHFQTILHLPQVAISKHLAYLRRAGLVTARRHRQWMIYELPRQRSDELSLQLHCLQDCVQTHPVFNADLRRLKKSMGGCNWLEQVLPLNRVGEKRPRQTARRSKISHTI